MKHDIFDIKNIEDVPDSIRKDINKKSYDFVAGVLDLLKIKSPLSDKQILVAYYRKYKKEISLQNIQARLRYMTERKYVFKKGQNYTLAKGGPSIRRLK